MNSIDLARRASAWLGSIANGFDGDVIGGLPDEDKSKVDFMEVQPNYAYRSNKYPESVILVYGVETIQNYGATLRAIASDAKYLSHKYNIIQIIAKNIIGEINQFTVDYLVCSKDTDKSKILHIDHPTNLDEVFTLYYKYKFDHNAVATRIWDCADTIRGAYKSYEYGELILPLVLVKRLAESFEEHSEEFWDAFNKLDTSLAIDRRYDLAMDEVGISYCNIYGNTVANAVSDTTACVDNLIDYIDSFRAYADQHVIGEILGHMNIEDKLDKLAASGYAYSVLSNIFCDATLDLSGSSVTASDMGFIFEHLIKKFNDNVGEGAGEHYTAPDIVKVMSEILIDTVDIGDNFDAEAYDMAMGTSQMLTVLNRKFTEKYGSDKALTLFGQELNGFTYAIACADALIRGVDPSDIRTNLHKGNTLTNDRLKNQRFDYIISNPPFGVSWKAEYDEVKNEYDGFTDFNRFSWGLPAKSDGQMLFTCNGIDKLKPNGVMAIIHNGSPLFSGNAGSGEASIREGIITSDSLLAIIKLPNDMFYNVGITTYIWVIGHKKSQRFGKVQLIDASKCCTKMRKSKGNKRNEITDECREAIVKAFTEFKNNEVYVVDEAKEIQCESKIFDNSYFQGQPDDKGRYKWEIPFDKIFYKAEDQENSDGIKHRILKLNDKIQAGMEALFGTTTLKQSNSEEVQ